MVMYVMYDARYLELHIQVGRTGGQICSLISELVFFSERGGPPGGGHTKWKCTLILQKKTKVLQTNPMQNLNLVGPPPEALLSHKKTKVLKSGYRFDPISSLPVCEALDILLRTVKVEG